jgi:hypothetical protein
VAAVKAGFQYRVERRSDVFKLGLFWKGQVSVHENLAVNKLSPVSGNHSIIGFSSSCRRYPKDGKNGK